MADRPAAPGAFILDDVGTGQWISVSTGGQHTCAIDRDGRAWCWGSNAHLQLGTTQSPSMCGTPPTACSLVPVPVATGRRFIAISAGRSHTCAISMDSVPYCWGDNSDGQLGVTGGQTAAPQIPGSAQMRSIAAGSAHSCGVRTDNQLVCWGSNRFGAVGAGAGTKVPPTLVGGTQRFLDVLTSDQRSCARTTAGRVMCWGAVWAYTSGDTNYTTTRDSPALVSGLGAMESMGVGPSSACSVDATGFAWCWESNVNGESGTGPGPGSAKPRRVASDEEFTGISVGDGFACGATRSGAGYCWGTNRSLQIGATATEVCGRAKVPCATRPLRIAGRQHFIMVAAGLGAHACGVTDQFNLYCWGAGSYGQRGDGTFLPLSRVPRLAVEVHKQ